MNYICRSNCRTWVFEKQAVNGKPDKIYHLNSDIETGLFWYDDSDPSLRCRVRRPRAEWESVVSEIIVKTAPAYNDSQQCSNLVSQSQNRHNQSEN